jgi:hypothetical protein
MGLEIDTYNPGPEFFREGAIAAANGERVPRPVPPETRYWSEKNLGAKDGLFGFPDYGTTPDHARVIAFLLLEIIAREGL